MPLQTLNSPPRNPEQPQHSDDLISHSTYPYTAQLTDAQLHPPQPYVPIKTNNQFIDFETIKKVDPLALKILQNHPLSYALTASVIVPPIYVHQFWHHLSLRTTPRGSIRLESCLDEEEFSFSTSLLLNVLDLPSSSFYPGRNDFDSSLTEDQMISMLRRYLPRIWDSFYGFLSHCLTPQALGLDKANGTFMELYLGFAFIIRSITLG